MLGATSPAPGSIPALREAAEQRRGRAAAGGCRARVQPCGSCRRSRSHQRLCPARGRDVRLPPSSAAFSSSVLCVAGTTITLFFRWVRFWAGCASARTLKAGRGWARSGEAAGGRGSCPRAAAQGCSRSERARGHPHGATPGTKPPRLSPFVCHKHSFNFHKPNAAPGRPSPRAGGGCLGWGGTLAAPAHGGRVPQPQRAALPPRDTGDGRVPARPHPHTAFSPELSCPCPSSTMRLKNKTINSKKKKKIFTLIK